ncbi:MAG: class I SAM-dependent methyltransferase [Dehalococcoidia bacterium]|nr:class I SAM-dependent methyltransferase [Dehalococcoidia bacterium]
MPVILREKWDNKQQYLEYLRHLAAYVLLAGPSVTERRVLDIGCGAGYGDDFLSRSAFSIVGLDVSRESVSDYWDKFRKDNLCFVLGEGTQLPFEDGSFDAVMSFQVIEHIEPKFVLDYLTEIKRVLRSGGQFICSTPNKKLRLLPFQKPWNPEHKKEYDHEEFKKLLSRVFEEVEVHGLHGSDEIQAIERNRVKQTPFEAYVERPLCHRMLHDLPSPILTRLKKMRQHFAECKKKGKTIPQETFTTKFLLDDFRIEQACPEDCLDLYEICTKVKG